LRSPQGKLCLSPFRVRFVRTLLYSFWPIASSREPSRCTRGEPPWNSSARPARFYGRRTDQAAACRGYRRRPMRSTCGTRSPERHRRARACRGPADAVTRRSPVRRQNQLSQRGRHGSSAGSEKAAESFCSAGAHHPSSVGLLSVPSQASCRPTSITRYAVS